MLYSTYHLMSLSFIIIIIPCEVKTIKLSTMSYTSIYTEVVRTKGSLCCCAHITIHTKYTFTL